MFVVHFFENNSKVLTQLLRNIPSVDENLKIKGRKGKVQMVKNLEDNVFHINVEFEKVIKKPLIANDPKKKRK